MGNNNYLQFGSAPDLMFFMDEPELSYSWHGISISDYESPENFSGKENMGMYLAGSCGGIDNPWKIEEIEILHVIV